MKNRDDKSLKKSLYRLFILLVSFLFLQGCGLPYVVKQGSIHLSHISARKPIETVLKNPKKYKLTQDEIMKLTLVQKVRQFAIDRIGLKSSENYTTYVKFPDQRKNLVYLVTACEKLELKPYIWSFPFVGEVPYKGFFVLEDAQFEAHYLRKKDLDIYIRGSIAFSTLGWFSDPVYSTVLGLEPLDLIDLIFHEMTHDTIYLKDSTELNESLATFVGGQATLLYLKSVYGKNSTQYNEQINKMYDAKLFSRFMKETEDKLVYLFKSKRSHEYKLSQKEKILEESKKRYKATPFRTKDYDFYLKLPLNNAIIVALQTYYTGFDEFEQKFQSLSQDFKNFISHYKNK
ncbi:MAG TPA: aminopeptidase [Bdellovibrionota bacterium]|nr:aminopeptidase [Bdellovibrionota bacterium]